MKSIIRNIIIIAVILILGIVGYNMFLAKPAAPASSSGLQTTAGVGTGTSASPSIATTSPDTTGDTSTVGTDFLDTLLSVESISLDTSLFSSKAFTVLQDFNRPIPPDTNPGRPDPFAPIGSDGASSVQVSTSNPSSITTTSAILNGTLLAGDSTTTRWFEYGTTNAFGIMTTQRAQTTPGAFTESINNLLPNTTYYVRADASVGGAIVLGNVLTWKTAQAAK